MNSIGLVVASSTDPTILTIVDTDSDDDPGDTVKLATCRESEAEPTTSTASAKPSSQFAGNAGAAERSR